MVINPEHFMITLARGVEIFRTRPDAVDDQKASLRALVGLCKIGDVRIRLNEQGGVEVLGVAVADGLPGVAGLVVQLKTHGVREIRTQQGAKPADLLALIKALAASPGLEAVFPEESTVQVDWDDLAVQGTGPQQILSMAHQASDLPDIEDHDEDASEEQTTVAESKGIVKEGDNLLSLSAKRSAASLDEAISALLGKPGGDELLSRTQAVGTLAQEAIAQGLLEQGVDAFGILADLEEEAADEASKRAYDIAIQRGLTSETLKAVADLVVDSRYADKVSRVLAKGGSGSRAVLLGLLDSAASVRESQAYLQVLKGLVDDPSLLVSLLGHKHWFIAEGVGTLLGELKLVGAVPQLIKALKRDEPRVRQAVAGALAKIGAPEGLESLREAIADGDDALRSAIVRAVQGKEAGTLASPIIQLAEEKNAQDEMVRDCYKALGRIGTPEAVRALFQATEAGGRVLGRRSSERRVAAIEGLQLVDQTAVIRKLESLAVDKDTTISQSAKRALVEIKKRKANTAKK